MLIIGCFRVLLCQNCAKRNVIPRIDLGMDDDIEEDFFSALYVALNKLEVLDPTTRREPWFKLLEPTADKTLAPHIKKAHKAKKKRH